MAHFRGQVIGARGAGVSRLGRRSTGLTVEAQSWQGKVTVTLSAGDDGVDYALVKLEPHGGQGQERRLYYGPVGGPRQVEMPLLAPPATAPTGELRNEIYRARERYLDAQHDHT